MGMTTTVGAIELSDRAFDTNRSHNRYPVTVAKSFQSAIAHNNSSPKIEPLFPLKIP